MRSFSCGYATIIGPPNAGKSTLLNSLLRCKLSIVTPKPQTTRKKIVGIYHNDHCQIIFFDTPGIMKPVEKLHESMLGATRNSLQEADVIVAMIPVKKKEGREGGIDLEFADLFYAEWLKDRVKPLVVVLNKVDLLAEEQREKVLKAIQERWSPDKVLAVSALKGTGVEEFVELLIPFLPLDHALYPEDILSIAPERFFVSEIIREKIFLQYGQEIPYAAEVVIDEFREQHEDDPSKKDVIRCSIIVERDSQKHILIGKKGSALKKLGTAARKGIETFLDRPVFLEIFVKVRPNWRKKKGMLKSLGY